MARPARRAALILGFATALLAFGGASAIAAPVEIRWADFSATQQECHFECTQRETVQHTECWWNGYDVDCDTWSETVCVAGHNVCSQVRKPLPDGDLINVSIQHGATDPAGIEFKLVTAPGMWWKQIMASGGPDKWTVWTENDGPHCNWPQVSTPNCDTNSEWAGVLLGEAGQITFSKAKWNWGIIHADMYILRDLSSQLRGGDRVTFTWVRD